MTRKKKHKLLIIDDCIQCKFLYTGDNDEEFCSWNDNDYKPLKRRQTDGELVSIPIPEWCPLPDPE